MFPRYFPTDPLQYARHTIPKPSGLDPEPFLWHTSLDETMNALGCRNVAQQTLWIRQMTKLSKFYLTC
ncbi:hypothetical protein M405DRAFT_831763 [Rhizopogon salebrosus TDB-379]|nr:hypothetical protein M405DRAFT_831763 [Rhizopogon salebrosus TDB-379]